MYSVLVEDHRNAKGFRLDVMHLDLISGLWTLHVTRIMLETQKESSGTTLLVCICKIEVPVEQIALIFMKLRLKTLSSCDYHCHLHVRFQP